MDLSALTPPRRHLIAQANSLINWLLDAVEDALAPGVQRTLPGLKSLYRDYLLPAEAALRRALHILTADLPASKPRAATALPPRKLEPATPKAMRFRPPVFRLGEPQPRPKTGHLPARLQPRISIIGVMPRPAPLPRRKLNEADFEAQLRRRLDAPNAAFANPLAAVRRLAKPNTKRPRLAPPSRPHCTAPHRRRPSLPDPPRRRRARLGGRHVRTSLTNSQRPKHPPPDEPAPLRPHVLEKTPHVTGTYSAPAAANQSRQNAFTSDSGSGYS